MAGGHHFIPKFKRGVSSEGIGLSKILAASWLVLFAGSVQASFWYIGLWWVFPLVVSTLGALVATLAALIVLLPEAATCKKSK